VQLAMAMIPFNTQLNQGTGDFAPDRDREAIMTTSEFHSWLQNTYATISKAGPPQPNVEDAKRLLAQVVEDKFAVYQKEVEEFKRRNSSRPDELEFIVTALLRWDAAYWGFDVVRLYLENTSSALSQRIQAIRDEITSTYSQYRAALENALRTAAVQPPPWAPVPAPMPFPPPPICIPSWFPVIGEQIAKNQQAFAYSNKLTELVRNGVPFEQARFRAEWETGFRSW
jgi:hypothetical protein